METCPQTRVFNCHLRICACCERGLAGRKRRGLQDTDGQAVAQTSNLKPEFPISSFQFPISSFQFQFTVSVSGIVWVRVPELEVRVAVTVRV